MNSAVMFSRASDEWSTPQAFFDALDAEFGFGLDAAATAENTKCLRWLHDALNVDWPAWERPVWLNPPYSRVGEFIAKADLERDNGCTVVCLVPARTDTRWYHAHIWDREFHRLRPGVEVRFIKGRLKFGDAANSAPFPSMVVIFRPVK